MKTPTRTETMILAELQHVSRATRLGDRWIVSDGRGQAYDLCGHGQMTTLAHWNWVAFASGSAVLTPAGRAELGLTTTALFKKGRP